MTQPTGVYDIIVSYAGEKEGQGSLSLPVGGSEKLTRPLNEKIGCWKRKTVPQITVQSGDEIRIAGVAVGSEGIRVDIIEVIPRNSRK